MLADKLLVDKLISGTREASDPVLCVFALELGSKFPDLRLANWVKPTSRPCLVQEKKNWVTTPRNKHKTNSFEQNLILFALVI